VTSIPIVDGVFDQYASVLGRDFIAYRNHVHRVVNLCLAATGASRDDLDKIAVAAAFHDLGIWTDRTFDYIAPSISLAREHLAGRSRAGWIPGFSLAPLRADRRVVPPTSAGAAPHGQTMTMVTSCTSRGFTCLDRAAP
jgi:hypothetical protein